MKKVFKIARYDFKRLMFNPITIVTMVLILAVCFVFGLIYKAPNASAYEVTTAGQTTKEVFLNFKENSHIDNKSKIDAIFDEAKDVLTIQSNSICQEYDSLGVIKTKFEHIKNDIEKYERSGSCIYTEEDTLDAVGGQSIIEAKDMLTNFVSTYANMEKFHSRMFFKTQDFEKLQKIGTYFEKVTAQSRPISEILDDIVANKGCFNELFQIANSSFLWTITTQTIDTLEESYVTKAETKMANIFAEMESLYNQVSDFDMQHADDMRNLVKNYKLSAESAKFAVIFELELLLNKYPSSFYGYEKIQAENVKIDLTKIDFLLSDENLYYTQYQEALNFNTASYKTTAYDYSYMQMSIIGFLTILFGIFCAYKLFGRDRRNGKMDLILSQNVTFNQVFVGKFFAIVFCTLYVLTFYAAMTLIFGIILYGFLPNSILAVFNLGSAYTISPFVMWLIKIIGLEFQVLFYSVLTILFMNLSRKFDVMFVVALMIFAVATTLNIFLNGAFWYCLFPFIHADLTSFLGGATMESGFLKTALYANGNFFISLAYYVVIVALVFSFTKQLFKKN